MTSQSTPTASTKMSFCNEMYCYRWMPSGYKIVPITTISPHVFTSGGPII
jgi:hypothetical protein